MSSPRGDESRAFVRAGAACLLLVVFVAVAELLPWGVVGVTPLRTGGGPLLLAHHEGTFLTLVLFAVLATAVSGLAVVVLAARIPITRFRWPSRLVPVLGLSAVAGVARYAIVTVAVPDNVPIAFSASALVVATLEMAAVLTLASHHVDSREAIRAEERRAAQVRRELEQEELRIRRDVSRQLHGGLQQRLVVATSELDEIGRRLDERGQPGAARSVEDVSRALDTVREHDVRALAHALYPLAVDIDLHAAILLLGDQLPAHVHLRTVVPTDVRDTLEHALSAVDRLYLFGVVEEAATNAIRHGGASSIHVRVGVESDPDHVALVTVDNDGTPLPRDAEQRLSGLAHLRGRVEHRGGRLLLEPSPLGGVRVSARLPLDTTGRPGSQP